MGTTHLICRAAGAILIESLALLAAQPLAGDNSADAALQCSVQNARTTVELSLMRESPSHRHRRHQYNESTFSDLSYRQERERERGEREREREREREKRESLSCLMRGLQVYLAFKAMIPRLTNAGVVATDAAVGARHCLRQITEPKLFRGASLL